MINKPGRVAEWSMATVSSAVYALQLRKASVPFTKVAGVRIPSLSDLSFCHFSVLFNQNCNVLTTYFTLLFIIIGRFALFFFLTPILNMN